jgi:uncharacterized protein (DUF1778 family)
MGQAKLAKDEVINTRVDQETKEFLKKAAQLSGLDLSAYVISRVKAAAVEDILRYEEANRILFNKEDFAFAKEIADAPANINERLKKAMKKHIK